MEELEPFPKKYRKEDNAEPYQAFFFFAPIFKLLRVMIFLVRNENPCVKTGPEQMTALFQQPFSTAYLRSSPQEVSPHIDKKNVKDREQADMPILKKMPESRDARQRLFILFHRAPPNCICPKNIIK